MFRKINDVALLALLFLLCASCKKNESGLGNPQIKQLPGTLYWVFAGNAGYHDFKKNEQNRDFMSLGPGSYKFFEGFDISWDNKNIMLTVLPKDHVWNHTDKRLVIRERSKIKRRPSWDEIDDGQNIADFVIQWDGIGVTTGHLSPDGNYIAIDAQSFADLPILIVSVREKKAISGFQVSGVNLSAHGTPVWTSANEVYFRIGNFVHKSSPKDNYQSAPSIFKLPAGATSLTVNPQGTKLAFRHESHIWICNTDGSNLVQVTTSEAITASEMNGEFNPTFSPDGKYLAFLTRTGKGWLHKDWWPSGEFVVVPQGGKYGYIMIIPADGKLYGEDNHTKDVIFLTEKDGTELYGVPADHWYPMIWR